MTCKCLRSHKFEQDRACADLDFYYTCALLLTTTHTAAAYMGMQAWFTAVFWVGHLILQCRLLIDSILHRELCSQIVSAEACRAVALTTADGLQVSSQGYSSISQSKFTAVFVTKPHGPHWRFGLCTHMPVQPACRSFAVCSQYVSLTLRFNANQPYMLPTLTLCRLALALIRIYGCCSNASNASECGVCTLEPTCNLYHKMVFAIAITFATSSVKQWTSATLASTFGSVPGLQQTSCTSPCQALWPQWYNRDAGEACNTPVVALFGHCGDMNWQLLLDSTSGVGYVHIHVYTHMLWPLHEDVFHCNKGMMSLVLSPFLVCYNCRRDAQSCCSL